MKSPLVVLASILVALPWPAAAQEKPRPATAPLVNPKPLPFADVLQWQARWHAARAQVRNNAVALQQLDERQAKEFRDQLLGRTVQGQGTVLGVSTAGEQFSVSVRLAPIKGLPASFKSGGHVVRPLVTGPKQKIAALRQGQVVRFSAVLKDYTATSRGAGGFTLRDGTLED